MADDADEGRRQRGRGEQGGPDLHRLAVVGTREQARAQAAVLALRHLRDHGATSAAAAPIFMLAKKNGALAGARSFRKVCVRVAE